jgi:hypothetical protein
MANEEKQTDGKVESKGCFNDGCGIAFLLALAFLLYCMYELGNARWVP